MASAPQAFFLFGDDGVTREPDIVHAAAYIEPVDARSGEYDAVFDLDGRRNAISVVDERTNLIPTDEVDLDGLRKRLSDAAAISSRAGAGVDPVAVAVAELRFRWERRWPRWPRWLDKRLNGDRPALVD